MKDKWRISFTICIAIPHFLAGAVGIYMHPGLLSPILWFAGTWLFCGLTIVLICGLNMPVKAALKFIPLWLFAIWSERVRDWVMAG